MKILALDIATKTGWAFWPGLGLPYESGVWNCKAKSATRARLAEPVDMRLKHLYDRVSMFSPEPDLVVIEDAQGFIKGKAAVEASQQFRAVVALYCMESSIRIVKVNPNDLLDFALHRRTCRRDEKKREMILHAQEYYNYAGNDDNEAEAIILMGWAVKQYDNQKGEIIYEPKAIGNL